MMQIISDLSETSSAVPTVLTIGIFDGVHLGHQALIQGVVKSAHASCRRAAVVTFFPHPDAVLGLGVPCCLTTMDEKLTLFEQLGIDLSVVIPFTPQVAQVRAIDFVEKLVRQLRMVELWAGQDFALGYGREGDLFFLRRAGARLGFKVHEVAARTWDGGVISSTRVRQALCTGDVITARHCLGRPFRVNT
jgi:riboflavin kinase/FMN adenylyltransferase